MNSKTRALAFVLVALVAATGGWLLGRSARAPSPATAGSGGSPPAAGAPATAEESVAALAAQILRMHGTFGSLLETVRAEDDREHARQRVIAFGDRAYDAILAYLGKAPAARTPEERESTVAAVDPDVRQELVRVLATVAPERAGPELARRLRDPDEPPQVRAAAAASLARAPREVAVPALVGALDEGVDRAWPGLREVVDALQFHGGEDAGRALLLAFQKPAMDLGLRIRIAEAIGVLRYEPAAPALETVVRLEETDHYVRRAALNALLVIDAARADGLAVEQMRVERDQAFAAWLASFAQSRGLDPRR